MMKELECDEPYEASMGCPTVTFELTDRSLMLPWSSFASGSFNGGEIKLTFQKWEVKIVGIELDEVWKLLQMQDLRLLKGSGENFPKGPQGCRIDEIVAERKGDFDSWQG